MRGPIDDVHKQPQQPIVRVHRGIDGREAVQQDLSSTQVSGKSTTRWSSTRPASPVSGIMYVTPSCSKTNGYER